MPLTRAQIFFNSFSDDLHTFVETTEVGNMVKELFEVEHDNLAKKG